LKEERRFEKKLTNRRLCGIAFFSIVFSSGLVSTGYLVRSALTKVGPKLEITPLIADLGSIAATGQELNATFRIANTHYESANVRLAPTCGCIILSETNFALEAGAKHDVRFSFSTTGRTGQFHAEIHVFSDGECQNVVVRATLLPQVFAFPNRVVLLPSSDGFLVGEFRIEAPEELWPKLQLVTSDTEFKISEKKSAGAFRSFQLKGATSEKAYSPIVLRLLNQDSPVLSIPVISSVP